MKLGLKRNDGESWRDCAVRYGKRYSMEKEVVGWYDQAIKDGDTEEEAAWSACCEWDVLDIIGEQ